MLHVRLVSGQEVATIPMEEVNSVREVKRYLHQHHGLAPRFRQRLMLKGSNMKLDALCFFNCNFRSLAFFGSIGFVP